MGFTRNIALDRLLLGTLLQRLGLPLSLASPLLAHAASVADSADRLGLVSPGDVETLVARHTADSLLFALARQPEQGERWADVGSGAGFPGLVLACCYPTVGFTLIEPNKRRAGFLELQIAELGLANTEVVPNRLDQVKGDFDVAVARALAAPGAALRDLMSLLREGGTALVASGSVAAAPPGAQVVRLEALGAVDSPGVLFMMSRKA